MFHCFLLLEALAAAYGLLFKNVFDFRATSVLLCLLDLALLRIILSSNSDQKVMKRRRTSDLGFSKTVFHQAFLWGCSCAVVGASTRPGAETTREGSESEAAVVVVVVVCDEVLIAEE